MNENFAATYYLSEKSIYVEKLKQEMLKCKEPYQVKGRHKRHSCHLNVRHNLTDVGFLWNISGRNKGKIFFCQKAFSDQHDASVNWNVRTEG